MMLKWCAHLERSPYGVVKLSSKPSILMGWATAGLSPGEGVPVGVPGLRMRRSACPAPYAAFGVPLSTAPANRCDRLRVEDTPTGGVRGDAPES